MSTRKTVTPVNSRSHSHMIEDIATLKVANVADASSAETVYALANAMKAALVANGLMFADGSSEG